MRGCSLRPVQCRSHRAQVNNKYIELFGEISQCPEGINAKSTLSATTDPDQGIPTPLQASVWCVLKTHFTTIITL